MRIVLILFLLCSFSLVWGQGEVQLFRLDTAQIDYNLYPWGEEMRLEIIGISSPALDKGVLTAEIFYEGFRLYWTNIPLLLSESRETITFKLICDPINQATQKILPGEYVLRVEFKIDNQELQLAELLKQRLGDRTIQTVEKKFNFGKAEKVQETFEETRDFYLQRIVTLNNLFSELAKQQKVAMFAQVAIKNRKENPFVKDGVFSQELWGIWWLNFLKKLENEKLILQKRKIQSLVILYPNTHNNLLIYSDVIEQLSRTTTVAIYEYYRLDAKKESSKIDTYRVANIRDTLRYIRELHHVMAQELKIDLQARLGYFPPPPIR